LALRLASAYGVYWSMRAEYAESADWLSAALGIADDTVPAAIRAAALETYAGALAEPRTLERATQAALDGLALRRAVGDPAGVAASLVTLATLARQVHRSQDAYRYAAEAERLAEGADTQVHTDALHLMALMAPSLERALELGERAAAAHRATGNRRRLALLQTSLAYAGLIHGDDEVATHLIAEGIDAAKALTDPRVLSMAYGNAGLVALLGRDIERARVAFGRELELVTRHRFARHRFEPLNGLAAVAAADGRDMLAATLSGAADASSLDRHHPAVARRLDEGFFPAPNRRRPVGRGLHGGQPARARPGTRDRPAARDDGSSAGAPPSRRPRYTTRRATRSVDRASTAVERRVAPAVERTPSRRAHEACSTVDARPVVRRDRCAAGSGSSASLRSDAATDERGPTPSRLRQSPMRSVTQRRAVAFLVRELASAGAGRLAGRSHSGSSGS
jgi:hypothetical protein